MLQGMAAILTCWSTSAGRVLVAEVTTVVVTITSPVVWDATATGAAELAVGTGLDAAHLITTVSTVIICTNAQPHMNSMTSKTLIK